MDDYENLLDKWFQFREEELESNLNEEDKKYSYCFVEHRNNILNCIGEEIQNLVNNELDKLERQVMNSIDYFNKKYYVTGFKDVINLILDNEDVI